MPDRRAGLLVMVLCLVACNPAVRHPGTPGTPAITPLAAGPESASYEIDGRLITLIDDRDVRAAAPGSAIREETRLLGEPVQGDLDGDGDDDALLWLLNQPGGTGSFYYLAAALNHSCSYRGTRAHFLGDRIAPGELAISNGLVRAGYRDRGPGEAMAARPHIHKTAWFTFQESMLAPVGPLAVDEDILQGWLVIGHEVRQFRPCSGTGDLWLQGTSAALQDVLAAHRSALVHARPYMPLFVTLAGHRVAAPSGGFGAAYAGALNVTRLVQVWPQGNCSSDRIRVQAPLPGATVHSPLVVRGRARGNWYFEGDFPLQLLDGERNVVARGYATAAGEWMTGAFVPFRGTLVFERPPGAGTGLLVLEKDNASGRPALDEALELPVGFE